MAKGKYSVKDPISAILHKPGGEQVSVTLPTGAVVYESSQHSTTLLGMVGVYWEGRHYSVALSELLKKTELVSTA
jgi:hypothetical protein